MSKAARLIVSRPASTASSKTSHGHELISIALFSGIGLLIALLAILCGVQGAWF
jgi:hypothetical protein